VVWSCPLRIGTGRQADTGPNHSYEKEPSRRTGLAKISGGSHSAAGGHRRLLIKADEKQTYRRAGGARFAGRRHIMDRHRAALWQRRLRGNNGSPLRRSIAAHISTQGAHRADATKDLRRRIGAQAWSRASSDCDRPRPLFQLINMLGPAGGDRPRR